MDCFDNAVDVRTNVERYSGESNRILSFNAENSGRAKFKLCSVRDSVDRFFGYRFPRNAHDNANLAVLEGIGERRRFFRLPNGWKFYAGRAGRGNFLPF